MVEVFQNIQVPKIDYGVLKSIKGISDTIGHLGLPPSLMNLIVKIIMKNKSINF